MYLLSGCKWESPSETCGLLRISAGQCLIFSNQIQQNIFDYGVIHQSNEYINTHLTIPHTTREEASMNWTHRYKVTIKKMHIPSDLKMVV